MLVVSMVLLASVSGSFAQEQERKLADRILRPNMSLVNSAQNKQFGTAGSYPAGQVQVKSFFTPDKSFGKSFAAGRAYSARPFATRHFQPGDTVINPERAQLAKTDAVHLPAATEGTRVAPENGSSLAAPSFSGSRPFLGRGKSQKALSARDTPLTIEQVRELLNKNK
jgi:hypothetical protein